MTTEELNNYILHYLRKDKTHTAIMLTGEWGSGKTYYVEHDLITFLKENKVTAITVSLYGLNDVAMISKSIYMELRMSVLGGKSSEVVTTGKLIAKNIIKNIIGLAGINVELSDDELIKLYESVNLENKLLILEDVERSSINIAYLLGYVNGLVERDGVKVLLIANENEILKKENGVQGDYENTSNKDEAKYEKEIVPEEINSYLRIKEKTISDTIQFNGNVEFAIKQIINQFDNQKLNMLFNDNEQLYNNVSQMVKNICNCNLRTFIYAIQKTVDIIDKISEKEYDEDFFECLMFGIISLSARIKGASFPRWEGSECLSTKLGSNDMPLMRFAYEFVRWQTFNGALVDEVYKAYKDFKFLERNMEYKDPDFRILSNYDKEIEEHVLIALKNIEKKLYTQDAIGIHMYCKLAYYMIYVGSVVGFDCKESCELMIKNAKGVGRKTNMDAEMFFLDRYNIEDVKIKELYEGFISRLSEAISYKESTNYFTYAPSELKDFYNDICNDSLFYISGHRFLSKYDQGKIMAMLMKSTSEQLQNFRGILFTVYRYAKRGEFDEADVQAMKQLLKLIDVTLNGENEWDKIQLMQINWLKLNLNQFIEKME